MEVSELETKFPPTVMLFLIWRSSDFGVAAFCWLWTAPLIASNMIINFEQREARVGIFHS
jgi:hypothetical protein